MQNSPGVKQLHMSVTAQSDDKTNTIRAKVTFTITCLLAAQLISKSDFPNKYTLPKLYPPAFNNFGHQLLMDYELLLRIIWEVIEEIKLSLETSKAKRIPWIIASIVAFIVFFVLAIISETPLLATAAVIGPIVLYAIGQKSIHKSIKKEVADIRATTIRRLMKGEWESANEEVHKSLKIRLKKVGNGLLDGDRVPVITVIDNKEPFTGYGRLQAENLFVCRPKEKEDTPIPSLHEIREAISKNLVEKVQGLTIKDTSFGEVVVIHGDSLSIGSKWLDNEKAPILWINKNELENVQAIDPKASIRTYFAAQIFFPQYMTIATFFVRPFWAGNSASCQIAVTTLGPPVVSLDYLQMRLLKYEGEMEEESHFLQETLTSKEDLEAVAYLRWVRVLGQTTTPFQSDLNIQEIQKLDIPSEIDARGSLSYQQEYNKIIKESAMWPGSHYKLSTNWRENNSFTFTTDFFGKPEALASVRTLYDQISRTILDTLDTLGFDISDYRDKEGKYSINAEKIEQLVVGERVHIDKSTESKSAEQSVSQTKSQAA